MKSISQAKLGWGKNEVKEGLLFIPSTDKAWEFSIGVFLKSQKRGI